MGVRPGSWMNDPDGLDATAPCVRPRTRTICRPSSQGGARDTLHVHMAPSERVRIYSPESTRPMTRPTPFRVSRVHRTDQGLTNAPLLRPEERDVLLVFFGLASGRGSALRAEIFVEVAAREDQEQALSRGGRLSAMGTEQERGLKRSVMVLPRGVPPSAHLSGHRAWRNHAPRSSRAGRW